MAKLRNSKLIMGTEVKNNDVAYILPIGLLVVGLFYFIFEKYLIGFIFWGIGALLLVLTAIFKKIRKNK